MQIYKDGIERTIKSDEWQHWRNLGYVQVKKTEEQPKQDNVIVQDDYTVAEKVEEIEEQPKSKTTRRKKGE